MNKRWPKYGQNANKKLRNLTYLRVRVLLAELTAEGRIEPKGEGRARVYIAKE